MKLTNILKIASCAVALTTANMFAATTANADQVFNDDVIITFSLCVGNDCVNGESFGFDTIRLKENNLRIHFQDTSTSASFPSNDWRIVVNDSSNGGTNHFSIEDSSAGRSPFRVEAGASANALVVEADSDIGIGTLNPVVELHVVDGDSPTLRLEQDGSSGFTPQTYDMVANEANFFIRDVTNGSQLPFRIKPGADSNALFIAADNNVGFGTDAPSQAIHVRKTDSAGIFVQNTTTSNAVRPVLVLENEGGPQIWMTDPDATPSNRTLWKITANDAGFTLNERNSAPVFTMLESGNLTITGTLTTGGGTCGGGCDKVFEDDYDLPTIEEHSEAMWSNGYLPNVGPTIENEPINVSDKVGRMLNELEKAHIYIDQLNEENKMLKERLDKLEQRLQ